MGKPVSKSQRLVKRNEAIERQEYTAKMTPADRLKELDLRLGKGVGAVKERRRLQSIIDNPPKKKEKKDKKDKKEKKDK